jgi:hypothetical protein
MSKRPQGQKRPADTASRAVQIMREATEQAAGDVGDKITRAPKVDKKAAAQKKRPPM